MSQPHAYCDDRGLIMWRGSDDWFRMLNDGVARNLVARKRLSEEMLADLSRAIAEQDELAAEMGMTDD
jgi:hypothetical protein